MIQLSVADYLWFVDDCLDDMTVMVEQLGDDLANRRPDLPGANSPYAILTHCLGVLEFWGGAAVAGREIQRDRDAEFVATGAVSGMRTRVEQARQKLDADLRSFSSEEPPRAPGLPEDAGLPFDRTQAGVLLHVFHELAQHRGQMEITRDLLRSGSR
jgi:hypothetical protein